MVDAANPEVTSETPENCGPPAIPVEVAPMVAWSERSFVAWLLVFPVFHGSCNGLLPQPACTSAYVGNMEEPMTSHDNATHQLEPAQPFRRTPGQERTENSRIATGTATTIIDGRSSKTVTIGEKSKEERQETLAKYNIIHSIHFNAL